MRAIVHLKKMARATFIYDTYCLVDWNEENERKNKSIKFHNRCLIVIVAFVNLSLA